MTNEEAIILLKECKEAHESFKDGLEALDLAISALERNRWISVIQGYPGPGKYVLAYSKDDDFMTVEAEHKFSAFQITHWRPLPEPPKEG